MTSTESSPAGLDPVDPVSPVSPVPAPVRDRTAHDRNVRRLLRPQSVAVIGASGHPTRIGGIIVSLLKRYKFPGQVFLVNPKYEEIQGFPCYPSVRDIPADAEIDVAILYLSVDQVNDVARACGERGVKGLVVISAGFAEVGGDGVRLQHELTATVNSYDMAMCGPNCAGMANFTGDFVAYGTTNFIDLEHIKKGNVALLSASGALGNTIFTYCQERQVGLSHLVGIGNEAVTTAADYLDVLVDDPDVSVIIGNIEAVRDPVRFFAAADRAAAAAKPIVVLKGGRSEAGLHSIMTHTAALGGSPQAFAGAFRQHGIIQVYDLDEMADCAMLLTRMTPVTGRRLGVFSLPGGGTGLVSDLAADHGFEVPDLEAETIAKLKAILPDIAIPKNPLDPTAGFGRDSQKLQEALRIFSADPNVEILVFFPLASQVDYSLKLAHDLVAVKDEIGKPIVAIWTAGQQLEPGAWRTLHDAGIPLFTQTDAAFRALERVRWYAGFLAGRADPEAADFGAYLGQAPQDGTARDELARFGVQLPRTQLATSGAEAASAAASFGRPVAMKIASPDIPHKTEAGGVRLGVAGGDAARAAFEEILASARGYAPTARIDGVEIQEMVSDGVEILLGVSTDDQLGPILTVGLGGVLTEVLRDVAQRPVPVSRAEARQMLAELRGGWVLEGFRGRPAADVDALLDAMLGLSALADAWRDRKPEIDLNPVVVLERGQGAVAVDALVQLNPT
jgi:acyl-CoA synthetase (NDP forming)